MAQWADRLRIAMDAANNHRRFPRVNVDEDHTARFVVGDRSVHGIVITNLSAGGCCVKVPSDLGELMAKGTSVSMLVIVHPGIPNVPLQATVCWLLGQQGGGSGGFNLVGLEFVNPNPKFQRTLAEYVEELFGET